MESTISDNIVGRYWRADNSDDTIFITVENQMDIVEKKIEFGDMHEAIFRWFVDQMGFSSKTLIVDDDTKNHSLRLVAKVKFIEDGIVMAKLQGILE